MCDLRVMLVVNRKNKERYRAEKGNGGVITEYTSGRIKRRRMKTNVKEIRVLV